MLACTPPRRQLPAACRTPPHSAHLLALVMQPCHAALRCALCAYACPPGRRRPAACCLQQFIGAVEYLHSFHVAHRDIKLDNIVLDSREPPMIKICDFGFARDWEGDDNMMTSIGTPVYMVRQRAAMHVHVPLARPGAMQPARRRCALVRATAARMQPAALRLAARHGVITEAATGLPAAATDAAAHAAGRSRRRGHTEFAYIEDRTQACSSCPCCCCCGCCGCPTHPITPRHAALTLAVLLLLLLLQSPQQLRSKSERKPYSACANDIWASGGACSAVVTLLHAVPRTHAQTCRHACKCRMDPGGLLKPGKVGSNDAARDPRR